MEKIICEKCKNAYLQKNEEGYFCSSCGMFYPNNEENLLLGIHYYKEGRLQESSDCLMKAIVNDGSNYKALLYKALGDGFNLDEDSVSLEDVYEKILELEMLGKVKLIRWEDLSIDEQITRKERSINHWNPHMEKEKEDFPEEYKLLIDIFPELKLKDDYL